VRSNAVVFLILTIDDSWTDHDRVLSVLLCPSAKAAAVSKPLPAHLEQTAVAEAANPVAVMNKARRQLWIAALLCGIFMVRSGNPCAICLIATTDRILVNQFLMHLLRYHAAACTCISQVAEFIGGIFANSLSLMTVRYSLVLSRLHRAGFSALNLGNIQDAAHLLSDLAGFLISLFSLVGRPTACLRVFDISPS